MMTPARAADSASASKTITKRIEELGGWRGETLTRVRQLIHDADPETLRDREPPLRGAVGVALCATVLTATAE
jgi:hypothetical protein